jgi:hypothetical protein
MPSAENTLALDWFGFPVKPASGRIGPGRAAISIKTGSFIVKAPELSFDGTASVGYDFTRKMSFGLPNVWFRIGWVVSAVCLAVPDLLRAADPLPGAAIEFSDPGRGLLTTNLEPWRLQETLGNLEDGVHKPDTFDFRERQPAPLSPVRPGSLMQDRRAREGERNNSLSITADELVDEYIALQVLKKQHPGLDHRRELNSRTLSDQALGLLSPRDRSAGDSRNKDFFGRQGSDLEGKEEPAYLGLDYRNGLERPETLFNSLTTGSANNPKSAFSDLFQPGDSKETSPEAVRLRKAQEDHREQYKKILGLATPTFASTLEGMLKPPGVAAVPGGSLYTPPAPVRRDVYNPLKNANNSAARRGPLSPVAPGAPLLPGEESIHSLAPVYTPPVVPKPTFTAPKRVF